MIVNILIISIILLCMFLGYKKGLIEVAFRLVSFILSIILSLMLYGPVSNYIIDNTKIDDKIQETIANKINPEKFYEEKEVETKSKEIPDIINNYINGVIESATAEAKDNISSLVSNRLAITAVRIITLIILFIAIRMVLMILKIFTKTIANLPLISSVNKLRRNGLWIITSIINNIYSFSNMFSNNNNNR